MLPFRGLIFVCSPKFLFLAFPVCHFICTSTLHVSPMMRSMLPGCSRDGKPEFKYKVVCGCFQLSADIWDISVLENIPS